MEKNICDKCIPLYNIMIRIGKKFGIIEDSLLSLYCSHIPQEPCDIKDYAQKEVRLKRIQEVLEKSITHFLLVKIGLEVRDTSIIPVGLKHDEMVELDKDIATFMDSIRLMDDFHEKLADKLKSKSHYDNQKQKE